MEEIEKPFHPVDMTRNSVVVVAVSDDVVDDNYCIDSADMMKNFEICPNHFLNYYSCCVGVVF